MSGDPLFILFIQCSPKQSFEAHVSDLLIYNPIAPCKGAISSFCFWYPVCLGTLRHFHQIAPPKKKPTMITGTKTASTMIHTLDLGPLVGGGSFVDRFSSPEREIKWNWIHRGWSYNVCRLVIYPFTYTHLPVSKKKSDSVSSSRAKPLVD